jgi:hypothetical protein
MMSNKWEKRMAKIHNIWNDKTKIEISVPIHCALAEIEKKHRKEIQKTITKARQEVMMTELVHCEEAIERARHQERKEFIETLFDNTVFSKDQARRIKELEEEK